MEKIFYLKTFVTATFPDERNSLEPFGIIYGLTSPLDTHTSYGSQDGKALWHIQSYFTS